jgi:hypothetical protein
MNLAQYGAYFFVARQVEVFEDGTLPADAGLAAGTDRAALATRLAEKVDDASLTGGATLVRIDAAALALASSAWQRVFEVRDSLLACARLVSEELRPERRVDAAFGDYIVTRWVFREVLHVEIARRPVDREFPPSYDQDAKAGLADRLADIAQAVGFAVKDRRVLVQGASSWQTLGDARAALMRQVTP